MKVLLIRNTGIRGEGHVAGEEIEIDTDSARMLILLGKAVANDDDTEALLKKIEQAEDGATKKEEQSQAPEIDLSKQTIRQRMK